jgi:antitoxin component of MazEF toxin-antitoxin module
MNYTVQIRPKRQITLPKDVLEQMGVSIGDQLNIDFNNQEMTLTPSSKVALNALKEIQRVFAESNITEAEMLEELEKDRAQHLA